MTFDLQESRQLLAGTPASLRATLGGLSDGWLQADEGPGTWTPWQTLAHLTHVEERLRGIGDSLGQVFARAEAEGISTGAAADEIVAERLSAERKA